MAATISINCSNGSVEQVSLRCFCLMKKLLALLTPCSNERVHYQSEPSFMQCSRLFCWEDSIEHVCLISIPVQCWLVKPTMPRLLNWFGMPDHRFVNFIAHAESC